MSKRLPRLRHYLQDKQLDACLITKPENQQYFSGFTGGEASLLITRQYALLLTDFRYTEQAASQAPDFEIVRCERKMLDQLKWQVERLGLCNLAFEEEHLSYEQYQTFSQGLLPLELVGAKFDFLRMVKDDQEISVIRQAMRISEEAFEATLPLVRPGIKERDLAVELEYAMRKRGADKPAFDFIIVAGARSSLPHGQPSHQVLSKGDFVTFDFGAALGGYHSDITRTVVLGQPTDKQRKIYSIVLEAQLSSLEAVKAGVACNDVDYVAREIIQKAGYGECFGHALGHGVGLQIHEQPRLSSKDNTVLEPGMVVTVEPGIYIPGWGGVRIEDTVVVTDQGCEILSATLPKELIIL